MFYATKHADYECPYCQKEIQVVLMTTNGTTITVGCPICQHTFWDELDIQNSDVPRITRFIFAPTPTYGIDIEWYGGLAPRASFEKSVLGQGWPKVSIPCDACNQLHSMTVIDLDSAYNPTKDEWHYNCSNNISQGNPLANKSFNTLMHLDRWIEKQIVIQQNPLNQRYANSINPANYANVLIRDMVPHSEEQKSSQYGGLSKEELWADDQETNKEKIKPEGYKPKEPK